MTAPIPEGTRKTDRYVTPGVIIALILVGGLLIGLVATYVTYLTSIGRNPEPVLKYVGLFVPAIASSLGVFLQLVGRPTQTKIERNTGTLAGVVGALADAITPAAATPPAATPPAAPVDDDEAPWPPPLPATTETTQYPSSVSVPPVPDPRPLVRSSS